MTSAPETPRQKSPHAASPLATVAYVGPFLAFIACLSFHRLYPSTLQTVQIAQVAVEVAIIAVFSRRYISVRPSFPFQSALLGIAVFLVWVAPDLIWPGYRAHWIFQNGITGTAASSIPGSLRGDVWFVVLRAASSVLLVPVLEELFWRGWMMRWLVRGDFVSVPLGTYTAYSFWAVALLFASEHGPYWEVGLAAGIAYNWWIVRTRNLGDCILAHAVTNACLAAYVLLRGEWQYWL
jgi:CAAX prenyl protease-like protein